MFVGKASEENATLRIGYAYDSKGRLLRQTEGSITKSYGYDAADNRVSFSLSKAGAVLLSLLYTYDRQNRLQGLYKGGVCLAAYTYDNNGNRASLAYPQSGSTTTYGYNAANLLTRLTVSKQGAPYSRCSYRYALDGNQLQKEERRTGQPAKTTSYAYDHCGRLAEETTAAQRIQYSYDMYGNRASMTVTTVADWRRKPPPPSGYSTAMTATATAQA